MHRRHFMKSLAGLVLCPVCAPQTFAAGWGYEGEHGPEHWGDVDAASKVCSIGSQQSPIDISDAVRSQMPPLNIVWGKTADTIVNNGHTIQLNFAAGSHITFGGEKYELLQVHFHRPSEHLIAGKNFPMEAHFVHRNVAGNLAVVGVLMSTGRPNMAFSKVVATMPAQEGPAVKADAVFNPNGMLPSRRTYYRYSGSLTTPPCSEVVNWLLLTDPIQVAEADVAAFGKLYAMNARPAQKPNRRFVLRSS
jgi:carbonic anhydrase